jgi:hypothetical protein
MKTEVVRIKTGQMEKLRMLSDLTGHTVKWMVEQSIDLFLMQEAPVHEAAYRAAQKKLKRLVPKRHPVKVGLAS